jgi:hypothetical protein
MIVVIAAAAGTTRPFLAWLTRWAMLTLSSFLQDAAA